MTEVRPHPPAPPEIPPSPPPAKRPSLLRIAVVVFLSTLLAVLFAAWLAWRYFFNAEIEPVQLDAEEQVMLEQKLGVLQGRGEAAPGTRAGKAAVREATGSEPSDRALPTPYSELGADSRVSFTERELNGLIARESDLADRVAIDLAEDLVSLTMVVPVDPQFPLLGGKTLRAAGGLEIRQVEGRMRVALTGVSVWGVPLPDAWIGNLRNVDLAGEAGSPFWQSVADGIADIQVREGQLEVLLKPPREPAGAGGQ